MLRGTASFLLRSGRRETRRVGISLAQAQSEAARGRLAASDVEAGGGTVDRLDGKAVLGEKQCVSADTETEVEHMLRAERLQHRHQRCHRRMRHQPVGATLRRAHRSSHASTAVTAIRASPPCRRLCYGSHHKREAQMRETEMVGPGAIAISTHAAVAPPPADSSRRLAWARLRGYRTFPDRCSNKSIRLRPYASG